MWPARSTPTGTSTTSWSTPSTNGRWNSGASSAGPTRTSDEHLPPRDGRSAAAQDAGTAGPPAGAHHAQPGDPPGSLGDAVAGPSVPRLGTGGAGAEGGIG